MSNLKDVMVYILKNYPFKNELSNARLTKIIYLADWKHSLRHNQQITDIIWRYDNFGPFVWDILNTAQDNPKIFKTDEIKNFHGSKKILITLSDKNTPNEILETEKETLDFVINSTKTMNWDKFIQLVYSTYPILVSEKQSVLDLIALARQKKIMKGQASPI